MQQASDAGRGSSQPKVPEDAFGLLWAIKNAALVRVFHGGGGGISVRDASSIGREENTQKCAI